MKIPEYPPILTGTPEQQINQLREYLIRQIENQALDEAAKELAESSNNTVRGENT